MKEKRVFGNGRNEIKVDPQTTYGTDCCVWTTPITLKINGCHCDAIKLISRALMEFELNHPDLFKEITEKDYNDFLSKGFWDFGDEESEMNKDIEPVKLKLYTVKFEDGTTQNDCYYEDGIWWESVINEDNTVDSWVIKDKKVVSFLHNEQQWIEFDN